MSRSLVVFVAAVWLVSLPALAQAQASPAADEASVTADEATEPEEDPEIITVTTQKRAQSVQDVPLSVGVLSGSFLDDNGLYDLDDASEYIPGFQLQLQQPNTPSFVIRGISSDVVEPEAEPNISVFFDGVPGSQSSAAAIELFDLERIEVAKGPQGTLFSRGASNGAVNFIFRKPTYDRTAEAAIQYGNFNNRRLQLVVNGPLAEDTLAARVGFVYHEREGVVDNGADPDADAFNGKDTMQVRASILWEPTDDLKATLISFFQSDTPTQTAFKTMVPTLAALDPATPYDDDTLQSPVDAFGAAGQDSTVSLSRRTSGTSLLIDYEATSGLTISSISGYRRTESDDRFDLDGLSFPWLGGYEGQNSKTWFQEVRFNYDDGGMFTAFGGVSFFQEIARMDRQITFDQDPLLNNVLPLLTGAPLPFGIAGLGTVREQTITNNRTESYSAFLDGTLDLLKPFEMPNTLSLTGGARITTDSKRFLYTAPAADPASAIVLAFSDIGALAAGDVAGFAASVPRNPFSAGNPTLSNGSTGLLDLLGVPPLTGLESNALDGTSGGQKLRTDGTFEYIEPRGIVEWRPLETLLVYGSISRGVRSGGLDVDPRQGLDDFGREINKETVRSLEFGVKGGHDFGIVRFNGELAVYDYAYDDFQTRAIVAGNLRTINAGSASATGFEAAANFAFDMGISVFANVSYIDGGIDEGGASDLLGTFVDLSGNDFRLTPDVNVSGGVSYRGELTERIGVFASLLGSYKDDYFFNAENELATATVPQDFRQDAFALFNASLGLTLDGKFGLTGRVENMFDEEYVLDLGNTGRLLGVPTSIRGQPRFVTVTLDARF